MSAHNSRRRGFRRRSAKRPDDKELKDDTGTKGVIANIDDLTALQFDSFAIMRSECRQKQKERTIALKVFWQGSEVAEIDVEKGDLVTATDDFRPLWDEFHADGIEILAPPENPADDEDEDVIVDGSMTSFALPVLIDRLWELGFTLEGDGA